MMRRAASLVLSMALLVRAIPAAERAQSFEAIAAEASRAREANEIDRAAGLYRNALRLRPDWAEGWWYLGTLLYDRDDYAGAAEAFGRAAAGKQSSGMPLVMLGLSEAALGRKDDALQHLADGRRLGMAAEPSLRRTVLYTHATLLLERGDFEAAHQALTALVREDNVNPDVLAALGMSVLGMRPPIPVQSSDAGRLALQAGRAESLATQRGAVAEARRQYEELVRLWPDARNVHFSFGRFLLENHLDEDAVVEFQKEIEHTPDHLLARLGIAGVKLRTDPAGGLPYAEQAVRLNPDLAEGEYLLGALLLETGDPAVALEHLEKARDRRRDDARVWFALAKAYARVKRPADAAEARAQFERLNASTPGGSKR